MSDHWLMLEGPKEVTGVAKVTFDAWATKYYTRPRDGTLAVTDGSSGTIRPPVPQEEREAERAWYNSVMAKKKESNKRRRCW